MVAAAAVAWMADGWAQRELVVRVVAVVEDDAILSSDVDQLISQLLLQKGQTNISESERQELEKRALQELINSKLIIAKARSLGIEASFTEVEERVDQAIEENKRTLGGEEAFNRQLDREGLTLESLRKLYREQIRNRMLVDRVLAAEIDRGSLQVTEEDLLSEFEKRKDELPPRPDVVHLRTIYFALESSERAQSSARDRIEEIRRRVVAGEDFAELAREYSEDASAERGGDLGTLNLADLADQELAEAAASLDIGEISDPILSSYGYHLLQVTGKGPDEETVSLRHILIRLRAVEDDVQEIFQKATHVYDRLLAGAPFDSMAIVHSDDPATASSGGDLGWLRLNDLPEFFKDVLEGMNEGDISQVLREPTGFRIVKLVERQSARPYEFDEVKDEIRGLIEQERLASAYDAYIAGLRDQYYVDVRTD